MACHGEFHCYQQKDSWSCGYHAVANSVSFAASGEPIQGPINGKTIRERSLVMVDNCAQASTQHAPCSDSAACATPFSSLPQQEPKPFQYYFFSTAFLGIILAAIITLILTSTLPAATFIVFGGAWGLFGVAVGAALLASTIIWLIRWAMHQPAESQRFHRADLPIIRVERQAVSPILSSSLAPVPILKPLASPEGSIPLPALFQLG